MIAADPPRRCTSCHTTASSCQAKTNYQGLPCCKTCGHESES